MHVVRPSLEHYTIAVLAATLAWSGEERSTSGVLKDLADTLTRLGRAFEIVFCANLLSNGHSLG